MKRKNSTDRIGWADLTDNPFDGGCSPIIKGEISGEEACYGPDGWNLIYDERTDRIYSIYWVPSEASLGAAHGCPPEHVAATLDAHKDEV